MFILGRNELFLNSSKVLEAAEKFYLGSYIEEKDSIRKINGIEYAFDIPVNKGEDTERSFIRLLDQYDNAGDNQMCSTVKNNITTTRYSKLVRLPMKSDDDVLAVVV